MPMRVEFKYPCGKCGGRMFARPGGCPEGPNRGLPFAECFDCKAGAVVMGIETAEAKMKSMGQA